jgi:excisionase family DNA binding protein
MPEIEKLTYTVEEAAEALGISRSRVYKEMDSGRLRFVKFGRRRLVPRDAVSELLSGRAA